MNAIAFATLLVLQGGYSVVDPPYPANAYQGGTVVAVLEIEAGSVAGSRILYGDDPFVSPAMKALQSWRFPGDRGDGSAIVIVNFRGPNLYAVGSAASELKLRDHPAGLPLPRSVTEPRYPADSMGQGTVALHLRVARSGAVERTTVLKGLGSLTQACSDAARQWKFNPARNITGDMIQSDVYAVCVFRQPVLGKP